MRKIKKVFTAIKNLLRFFYWFDQSRQEEYLYLIQRELTVSYTRDVFYRQFAIDQNARVARENELEARKNKAPLGDPVPEAENTKNTSVMIAKKNSLFVSQRRLLGTDWGMTMCINALTMFISRKRKGPQSDHRTAPGTIILVIKSKA